MSRSKKKNPYVEHASIRSGDMKKWKKQCNSKLRKELKKTDDPVPLTFHKRFTDEWMAPNDGKHYWDEPKGYRK